jgi:alkyl hydroperoxide reductase subunit AhpF
LWYPFLNAEWFRINEEVAYRKIVVGYNNITKLRGLGKFFSRVRCKWEKMTVSKEEEQRTKGCSYCK